MFNPESRLRADDGSRRTLPAPHAFLPGRDGLAHERPAFLIEARLPFHGIEHTGMGGLARSLGGGGDATFQDFRKLQGRGRHAENLSDPI